MVNIFGDRGGGREEEKGSRGERGSIGPIGPRGGKGRKGDDGSGGIDDMCRWIPKLVLEQFQQDEVCCFTLADPHKDLIVGKGGAYTTWLSHSNTKKNAVADDHPSKQVLHISKTHNALVFDKSLYWVDDIFIVGPTSDPCYTYICITFQIEGETDQFIVSNYHDEKDFFRGISASNKEIRIWGVKNDEKKYLPIPHKTKRTEWTTMFVEWSNINGNQGSYTLNTKKELTFTCADIGGSTISGISIGARVEGDATLLQPFKGAISSLEIYTTTQENGLPNALKHLIINSQLIETKHEENEEPPEKKKKIQPINDE